MMHVECGDLVSPVSFLFKFQLFLVHYLTGSSSACDKMWCRELSCLMCSIGRIPVSNNVIGLDVDDGAWKILFRNFISVVFSRLNSCSVRLHDYFLGELKRTPQTCQIG